MAEQYIADVVRKGAKAIQHWREAHPKAPVMLVGLDLSGLNLVGADLSGANLSGCNLHLSTMISVNLSKAKMTGAKMRGANLVGANLSQADLQKAVLTGAILQNANLEEADLRGANLRRADLRGSVLRGTKLEGADLQDAIITEAEYAQLQGGASPRPEGRAEVEESEDLAGFVVELGVVITAVELARLLKALDDIHLLIGIGPVSIEQVAINLHIGGPDHVEAEQPRNCLVVRLDPKAAAWLQECLGARLEHLKSPEARILRYKKLGLSEEDVWHNVRPALEEGTDPLAVLRELFQKHILLSCGAGPAAVAAPPTQEPTQAALDQVFREAPQPAPAETYQPPAPEPVQEAPPQPTPAPAAEPAAADTGGGTDIEVYIRQLENDDWGDRAAAAEALGNLGSAAAAAMPYLMKTVEDENIFVREAAEDAIKKITGQG